MRPGDDCRDSSPARPDYRCFVGGDIAAASFTALWSADGHALSRAVTFSQSPTGFAAFQGHLQATGVAPAQTLIVLEAPGSYWIARAVTLHEAGYAVAGLNPAQLHRYAPSLPRRGKPDALDAPVFGRFARERRPSRWPPPPDVCHELRQRLVARDGLLSMRQQARNQRHALAQWPVQVTSVLTPLDGVIADLDARLASLEREIAAVLADGAWASAAALLSTIPGIGLMTSAGLLGSTLNFSLCATPEQAAAYAGVVPLQRESGTRVRGRTPLGHGGNGRVRTALYWASRSATRYNPAITGFYERLRAAGKPMKGARCAAARTLLRVAWAVVTTGQPFDAERAQQRAGQSVVLALAA